MRRVEFGSVLFAAGAGTRMRPITRQRPKPALPVLDLPLASFALSSLLAARPPVIVNLSRRPEAVQGALARWITPQVEFFVESPQPLGTAGTLAALRRQLAPTVLTANADVVSDLDTDALVATHARVGATATVAVTRVDASADFALSGEHVAALVDRRVSPAQAGWMFTGFAVFERAALEGLEIPTPSGLTEAVLRPLIARGEVAASRHHGYFIDVGTPQRYLQASLDLLEGRVGRLAARPPGRIVPANGGHCYIGPGASAEGVIGAGAILLAGSTVEAGARVGRAIVWPGARVPAGATVADDVFIG